MNYLNRGKGKALGIIILIFNYGLVFSQSYSNQSFNDRPNILWIFSEDLSPFIGAYGDTIQKGHTPTLDKMAENGVLFMHAYATAPVCSASRSAVITGVFQTTTGTHNHRSSRSPEGVVPNQLQIHLPEYMKTIPELMRKAGYFTFNSGKDDYNFDYDRRRLYSVGTKDSYVEGVNGWFGNAAENSLSITKDTWNARKFKDQPWFGQIELKGGKAWGEHVRKGEKLGSDDITIPPYFPDTQVYRELWAGHYNSIRGVDARIQAILDQLKQDGELEKTVIFFFSDHGSNASLHHKQFCYEGGLKIPLIIMGPGIEKSKVRKDLVSTLDISTTTLSLGGIDLPEYLDGKDLFSNHYKARDYVMGARDRCDFTIDRIRSVRTDKYRYIRNFYPERPLLQPSYRDNRPMVMEMKKLYKKDRLSDFQENFWFGIRPKEELYDIEKDPYQLNNLATDPMFSSILKKHRNILTQWIKETNDQGQYEESTEQLRAVYELWKDRPQFKNADVNPEYDQFKK